MEPELFKICLNEALTLWKKKCRSMGIKIENDILFTLFFADEHVVLAEDLKYIQYMVNKLGTDYKC